MTCSSTVSFTLANYARDRIAAVVVCVLCAMTVGVASLVLGVTIDGAAMLALVVLTAGCMVFALDYLRKRAYYRELSQAIEHLEKARHLSAFIEEPRFLEGRLSWAACETLAYRSGCELFEAQEASEAYERYVETWIHEIKTPIAASRLVLGRMRGPEATALRQELESIERFVEQVLYYARSQNVSTDYSIREISLAEVAKEACKRNQNMLIASKATLVIDVDEELTVFSDRSWLIFVLGQILSNAAKYGSGEIRICAHREGEGSSGCVKLEIADDGPGIPEADMAKLFDRGFVGENGRAEGSATGMGLFLCARLCGSMGVGIDAYSEKGSGTRIVLAIPVNREGINLTSA